MCSSGPCWRHGAGWIHWVWRWFYATIFCKPQWLNGRRITFLLPLLPVQYGLKQRGGTARMSPYDCGSGAQPYGRRTALPVRLLLVCILPEGAPGWPHPDTHRREAVPVRHLRAGLLAQVKHVASHEDPQCRHVGWPKHSLCECALCQTGAVRFMVSYSPWIVHGRDVAWKKAGDWGSNPSPKSFPGSM